MIAVAFKEACHRFAQAAAPYLPIREEAHYEEAVPLIENLLEEAGIPTRIRSVPSSICSATPSKPMRTRMKNWLPSSTCTGATRRSRHAASTEAQHQLGTADLPEIGSKSMVSRTLSGERSLNKNHIAALSRRFHIDPGLFF